MPVPVTNWRAAELSQPCDRAAFFFCWRGRAADSHSGRVPASVTGILDFTTFSLSRVSESQRRWKSQFLLSLVSFLIIQFHTSYCPRDANNFKTNADIECTEGPGPCCKAFRAERHHARLNLRSRSTDASTKVKPAPFSKATDELEQEDSMKLGSRRASLSYQQDQRPMLTVRCRSEGRCLRDRPI